MLRFIQLKWVNSGQNQSQQSFAVLLIILGNNEKQKKNVGLVSHDEE